MNLCKETSERPGGRVIRWCARSLALVTAVALVQGVQAPAAQADTLTDATVVEVAGLDLRAGLLTAIEGPRMLDASAGCTALVSEAALLERYRTSVTSTPAQVVAEFEDIVDSWFDTRGSDACALRSLDEGVLDLLGHAETAATTAATREAFRNVARRVLALSSLEGNGVGDRGLTASLDLSDHVLVTSLSPEQLLADAVRKADTTPAYAEARDSLLGQESGVSLTASVATLLAEPVLAGTSVPALVDVAAERLTAPFGELMGVAEDAEGVLDSRRDAAIAALASPRSPRNIETTTAPAGRMLGIGALLKKATTTAATVVKTAVNTVGRAVGALAKGVARGVGRLVSRVVASVFGRPLMVSAVALVRGLLADTHLLTQGLLSARGTSDRRVLDAIGGLRQDIATLRTEMNLRFDAIDAKLDEILDELGTRFDELGERLSDLSAGVEEVRDAVVLLSTRVERLERNLYELFRDGQNRDLWTQVNTAIGWRERSVDGAPMSNDRFLEFEGFFYSWATVSAVDTIATGPAQRSYADDDLTNELSAVPLEGALSYVNGLGQARFGAAPLSDGKLPNLRDYAVAARAYSALLLEHPEYVTPGVRQRLATVLARGEQVSTALDRLRQRDVPGVRTGSRVLNGALDLYRRAGTATSGSSSVASELLALEQAYLASRSTHLGQPLGVDPWGGTEQASPLDVHVPNDFEACGSGLSTLTRPATMQRAVAYSSLMRNAMRLDAVDGRVICLLSATDRRQVGNDFTADFTVEWRTEFRERPGTTGPWNVAQSRSITFQDVEWCQGLTFTCAELDVMAEVRERWAGGVFGGGWKETFEQSAALTSPGTPRLQELTAAKLGVIQRDVYAHLAARTSQGALAGALNRLTGARSLLESYVHLALPRAMQENDDLRGTFSGSDPLPAEGPDRAVWSALTAASASPPATNARLQIVTDLGERADALEAELRDAVTAAVAGPADRASVPTGLESNALVETSLSRLRLTDALAAPPPPATPAPSLTNPRVTSPRLSLLARDPITVTLRSATPGTLGARLTITAATARRFRLGTLRVIATRSQVVGSAGRVVVRLRATTTAARRLRPVARTVPAVLQLTLRAHDRRTARPLVVQVGLRP